MKLIFALLTDVLARPDVLAKLHLSVLMLENVLIFIQLEYGFAISNMHHLAVWWHVYSKVIFLSPTVLLQSSPMSAMRGRIVKFLTLPCCVAKLSQISLHTDTIATKMADTSVGKSQSWHAVHRCFFATTSKPCGFPFSFLCAMTMCLLQSVLWFKRK